MNKIITTFTVLKNTLEVIRINGDELKEPLSFETYFNKYIGKELFDITDTKYSHESLLQYIQSLLKGNKNVYSTTSNGINFTFSLQNDDKKDLTIAVSKSTIEEENNADYDYLTGVYSRRHLFRLLKEEFAKKDNQNSVILIIDLDNFKSVNDSYGHIIGDLCLKSVSEKLKKIYENHLFGRYGGDEFLVFLKNPSKAELDRLIQETLSIHFEYEKVIRKNNAITCSVGISSKIGNKTDFVPFIEEADVSLYRSKKKGKNTAYSYAGRFFGIPEKEKKKKNKNLWKYHKSGKTSPSLFVEEVHTRKIRYWSMTTGLVALLIAVVVATVFLNYFQTQNQAGDVARKLMGDQANDTSIQLDKTVNDNFRNLEKGTRILDPITYNGNKTNWINEMNKALSQNTLIENPAILLDNGDLYLSDGSLYNIASTDLANDVVIDNAQTVERISWFFSEDKILFGYPYTREASSEQDGNITIKGVVSIYDVSSFEDSLLSSFSNKTSYLGIVNGTGEKICETKGSTFNIFFNVNNVLNYFEDSSNERKGLENALQSKTSVLSYLDISGTGYYFFTSDTGFSDWKVLMVVPYLTIYGYFSALVQTSTITINLLYTIFSLFSLALLILIGKMRSNAFILKNVDPLTNTINEQRFTLDAQKIIKSSPTHRFLVYLNIRNFKIINSQLGSEATDHLLINITEYLKSVLEDDEILSRDYSGGFIMVLSDVNMDACKQRIEDIMDALVHKDVTKTVFKFSLNAGIYNFQDSDEPIWLAMDRAKTASEINAKAANECIVTPFNEKMRKNSELSIYIEQSQEFALRDDKFQVFYQGKYDLHNNKFGGAEALVRWKDDEMGYINTQTFVDVFEKNGFINRLDVHVFEKVLQDLAQKIKNNETIIPVSINLSREHFYERDFFSEYENLVKKYNIPGKYLEFEITESAILNDNINLSEVIDRIHKLGAKVSIDDFGSGFSNFSMINHINFDIIKIDRKLLFGKNGFDDYSKNILRMVTSLNKQFNKTVVCEGVENKEESDFLKSIGVDLIQGYYYSKPMPKNDFEELVAKTNKDDQ